MRTQTDLVPLFDGVQPLVSHQMDHEGLAKFLRYRRKATRPEDVGLAVTGARRTPGLRREEVARLARTPVESYERLERSQATRPPAELLTALARALRLERHEFEEMCRLAGRPEATVHAGYVEPGLMSLLDVMSAAAACVLDDNLTVVEQNALAGAVLGRCAGLPGWRANLVWHWFTDGRLRSICAPEQHAALGRMLVAELRAAAAWHGPGAPVRRMASELAAVSEEFGDQWATAQAGPFAPAPLAIDHDAVGRLEVCCEMAVSTTSGHRLLLLRAMPGTVTSTRLRQLSHLSDSVAACESPGAVVPLRAHEVSRVEEYMRARIGEEVTVGELAGVANVSKFHFIRAFRAATGLTPYRYLRRMRMRIAAEELRGTRLSVARVAAMTGYRSTGQFAAAFRKEMGVSPAVFRNARPEART